MLLVTPLTLVRDHEKNCLDLPGGAVGVGTPLAGWDSLALSEPSPPAEALYTPVNRRALPLY